MKTLRLFGIALVAILLSLTACSGGDDGGGTVPAPTPETPKSEIKIDSSITTNGVAFKTEAGEQSITFDASDNWALSIAETRAGTDWVTASATSGNKGSVTIKFTVTENTDYDDRSVAVTIKSGTASITFTITQKGVDAMLVTTTKYEVPQAGGNIEVEVQANITYQVEIPESSKGWIKETTTRALTATKHTFEIAANEEYDKREGEIIFKSGDKKETIKVYQTGGAIIMLTQNEYAVSDKGETITVELKSNCEYGVQMPDIDWIKEETTRAASSHTLRYIIAVNEDYDSRSAEIVYFDKNSDLKDTLTIIQAQKDAIIISKKEYTISSSESTIDIVLNSNVEYETTIVGDATAWISQVDNSNSRGLIESKLCFKITANETYDSRIGKIAIYDKLQALTDTITVTQKGLSNIMLTQKEYTVTSDGGTIDVELQSNFDFAVKMPDVDWITVIETRTLDIHKFSYKISENKGYDNRAAQIIYVDKNSTAADTLNIIQLQKNAIIISNKNVKVGSKGEDITVKLSTNVDFEIDMPSVDWIIKTDSRALTEYEVKFTIAKNESEEQRSANVVFVNKDNGVSDTLTILQDSPINLSLVQKEYQVTNNGGKIDVEVKSNIDVSVKMPNVDWITAMETSIFGTHKFSYQIATNEAYDSRSAQIIYYDKNSDAADTLTIIQVQKDAIILSQKEFVVEAEGDIIEVKLNTNVNFEIQMPEVDWIAQNKSRVLIEHTLTFIVSKNESEETRNAKIVFVNKEKGISEILIVKQRGLFNTTNVTIAKAGTLASILSDDMLDITSLKIAGPLNGDDIKAIRQMLGAVNFLSNQRGKLSVLDLTDASIVEGGGSYYNPYERPDKPYYAKNNEIGSYMFSGCYGLQSIQLPNNVTTIGEDAFRGCDALTSVTIPNSVTTIGKYVFYDCRALTSVTIGNGVTTIVENAFGNCKSLTSVTIPNSVTTIEENAFYYCKSLTSVTIPNSVNTIGKHAFLDCHTLTSVTIGNSVTTIGNQAFYRCNSLTSVTIPNSVTTIGEGAFGVCEALESVTIGSSVNLIRDYAFHSCSNLSEITCLAVTPPNLGFNVFMITNTLKVPKDTQTAYESTVWKDYFTNIVELSK